MMTLDKFYSTESKEDIEWFKEYRADWMTDDQWLCHLFLSQLFCGFHHITGKPKAIGSGIVINSREHRLATFDFDYLTKAVIMAHNWGVRFSVEGGGPGMIKILLFKRSVRDGSMSDRHPAMSEAVEKYKDK